LTCDIKTDVSVFLQPGF